MYAEIGTNLHELNFKVKYIGFAKAWRGYCNEYTLSCQYAIFRLNKANALFTHLGPEPAKERSK